MPRTVYPPIEANPTVFNTLCESLTLSKNKLTFHDVYSLDDDDNDGGGGGGLLSFIPRPALALILIFPTSSREFEEWFAKDEANRQEFVGPNDGSGGGGSRNCPYDIIWFKQTIDNACGLYGILHSLCSGRAREYMDPSSPLSAFIATAITQTTTQRIQALENSTAIETAHAAASLSGDTEPPEDPRARSYHHYVCFVKSAENNHLYELDGERKGPVDRGEVSGDVLSKDALKVVKEYMEREEGMDIGFGLMALAVEAGELL